MQTLPKSHDCLIFSVRLFSEITVKSAPVRKRWTKLLAQNIRTLGRKVHERTSVVQDWDRLTVRVPSNCANTRAAFIDLLGRIPGITNFLEVKPYPLKDMHDVYEKTLPLWKEELVAKTFCVRVKRNGEHSFSSGDLERYVGGGLNQNIATAGVRLKKPDVTIHIEVKDDVFFVAAGKYPGMGGFPLGTQEPVMSLVSGGFDSTVASFQMINRGMRTHFCFFNLGGRAHEVGVKEIAYFLWSKYGASHRVKFITVPFEGVVSEILDKINPSNMGVVLKRMMFRAAEKVAHKGNIEAIVTGEAISQVSSQTIPNLSIIDRVTDMLVLRPLIASAKPEIIQQARDIGVEDFSANIPEYCGVISVKPSAKVNISKLLEDEASFDFAILQQAIESCKVQSIDSVMDDCVEVATVEKTADLPAQAIVIDIRHPDEQEIKPFGQPDNEVLSIPFYRLNTKFEELDKSKDYYLYCDKGVMSELHASHLKESGYPNVFVFRPE
ncbi:tRNA uracil 4-sulfurtransferase ThiI [Agarilytica rhodophyticola]|uniref:tRNA uracil 4-sulfurtransferase ThiI n=1 Tax=Agarilytica rhodophyticola TaxID=1737490 RepID=UPI000B345645|nr:tRNA uracil 4-sulfurtransferase ThiI [Agarilytica rhodophyticola]